MAYADKYVHSAGDLPLQEHWAILSNSSVHVPAEGVWAPGHGYPEHTERFVNYEAFFNYEMFRGELERRMARNEDVRGIHVAETFHRKVVVSAESSGTKR
jgi:hypothetical protein